MKSLSALTSLIALFLILLGGCKDGGKGKATPENASEKRVEEKAVAESAGADKAVAEKAAEEKAAEEKAAVAAPLESVKSIVTVREITGDLVRNQLVAEKKYVGKVLTVSGTISKIEKDGGDYTIYCAGVSSVYGVKAYIAKSEEEKLASLKSGEKVTLRGKAQSFSSYDLTMVDVELGK